MIEGMKWETGKREKYSSKKYLKIRYLTLRNEQIKVFVEKPNKSVNWPIDKENELYMRKGNKNNKNYCWSRFGNE